MILFLVNALKIIFLLGFLIFIHELGHFTVAKLCNVKVNEFAIGFGPTIWQKQGKETRYALRLLPLGGFVSMEGEEERSESSRSFSKASIPKRLAIVVAGATVNIIFGLTVYFILTASSGPYISNEVDSVIEGYAAQTVGIQSGDKIVKINNVKISNKNDLNKVVQQSNGNELTLNIERNNEIIEVEVTPTEYMNQYYIGVNLKEAPDIFINRIINGITKTKVFMFSIVDNLKELFTGHIGIDKMMGPVGISETVAKTEGIQEFIYMMALISLSLGVTNLLPIPALDGGKIVILLIEAVRRKPMKEKTEMSLQLLGFSLLIALSLYVTYNDILRIF